MVLLKICGDKNEFAIEYSFENEMCIYESEDYTYGYIKIWVNGRDLCSYNGKCQQEGNIYFLIEWFCEKMEYILGYDPFPLPVKGETTIELLENANKKYDSIDDIDSLEADLWFEAKSRWIFNHCWFSVRDGILPCMYFRRVEEAVEISWDNLFWEESGIIFNFRKGVYIISLDIFTKVFCEFLVSSVGDIEQIIGEEGIKHMRKVCENIGLYNQECYKNIKHRIKFFRDYISE